MFTLLLLIIYLAFICLGLPDSLLGSAWPTMKDTFAVPNSWAGILSMTIALCTVISALQSDRLNKRFGTGLVTAVSVAMTAAAVLGFSVATSFWQLFLICIPYGLGAGSVDAALNNFVALHYPSRHMSWLHCMWGLGTIVGPYVIGASLTAGGTWADGYRVVGAILAVFTVVLFCTLPLWKKAVQSKEAEAEESAPVPLSKAIRLPGAPEMMLAFFCYEMVEQTTMLWASSYMVSVCGLDTAAAARYASLFFIGITAGRALNGFLTIRLNDVTMIRIGQILITLGILTIFISAAAAPIGFILIGLGCAPIYPCIIHSTPDHFGAENSQAMIGIQMASAYVGTCLMPPLFGVIAGKIGLGFLPVYLGIALILMVISHERLLRRAKVSG